MASEKSQRAGTKGQMLPDSTEMNYLQQAKAEGQRVDWRYWVPRGGTGGLLLNGCRVSVWGDDKFWKWVVVMVRNTVNALNATGLYTCKWLNW